MSEVKTALVSFVRPLKRELGKNPETGTCTHIITWGYTAESQLTLDGDFVYLYEQQIDGALEILKGYKEVDGIVVSRISIEKIIVGE